VKLREEDRVRAFENRVLRSKFPLKRDEVIGGSRKLQNRSYTTRIPLQTYPYLEWKIEREGSRSSYGQNEDVCGR
jgi:hypothetical protein